MTFTESVKTVFSKYAVFNGRASRSEFWYFYLFNILVTVVLLLVIFAVPDLSFLSPVYSLAAFIPGLAVTVRRLHDVGKSGWFILISLIPFIGGIWLLILYCTSSDMGDNQYGPMPE